MNTLGNWLLNDPASPLTAQTPAELDTDAYFDVKRVYQQRFADVDINRVPEVFRPRAGSLHLVDWEKVYTTDDGQDIFSEREISRDGTTIVVVRPDQYVVHVLPLSASGDLSDFFASTFHTAARTAG